MEAMEKYHKKNFGLMIVPTYRCNATCGFCYAKGLLKQFPKDMGLWNFIKIIERLKENGGNNLNFIGGEPALWKHLDLALIYARLRGLKTTVFTNASMRIKTDPDTVYVNIYPWLVRNKDKNIEENLKYYKEKGIRVILRYNFSSEEINHQEIKAISELFKRLGREMHLAPIVPYEPTEKAGRVIVEVFAKFRKLGINARSANPLPPCMFSEEDLDIFRKNHHYYSACYFGSLPLINPDGKTIQPCSKIFIYRNLKEEKSNDSRVMFAEEFKKLKSCAPTKCKECPYFKNGKCHGGCFVSVKSLDDGCSLNCG